MLKDLETPMYTQKQVLRLLPDLKPKTLQNWASRGILDVGEQRPGKQGRRLYTPVGVIALDFMQRVGIYGVPPTLAAEMADHIAEAAFQFWDAKPETIHLPHEKNSRWIPVSPDRLTKFRKARIVIFESRPLLPGTLFQIDEAAPTEIKSYLKFVDDLEDAAERFHNQISLIIEVDFMISQTINRMFLMEAGVI